MHSQLPASVAPRSVTLLLPLMPLMILEDQDFPTFTAKQGEVRSFEVSMPRSYLRQKTDSWGSLQNISLGALFSGEGWLFEIGSHIVKASLEPTV